MALSREDELAQALISLLEMPSTCVLDSEIAENNKRRKIARQVLLSAVHAGGGAALEITDASYRKETYQS